MSAPSRMSTRSSAITGILSAVAVILMLLAGVLPSGWLGVTALSGLMVAVAVSACGYMSGAMCYLVSGILGLLLVPAKQVPVLFLCFLGLYPIMKQLIERIASRVTEYGLKLLCFYGIFGILYRLAYSLFFQSVAEQWQRGLPILLVFLICGGIVFLAYDYAFSKVIALLQRRVINKIVR